MRNKYRNRLDMNKTDGNAVRFKLTNLQPALKNVQIKSRGKICSSWNQGCGVETQISGSSSSSRHPKFLTLAPAPERFVPFQTKTHCMQWRN